MEKVSNQSGGNPRVNLSQKEIEVAIKEISERVQRLHEEAIVVDMLECLFPPKDIGYFKTLVDAGVTAVNATVPHVSDETSEAIARTAKFFRLVENTENAKIVSSVADIESAKREGQVAIIPGMQGSRPFERNLDLIGIFFKIGFRVAQIAYAQQNYLGAGCVEGVDHGLTDRGREAVKELNRLGILIDVSHCGDKTAMDAAEASNGPIAITHATPSTVVEIRRAKSDDTIKAVAERGGVIGQVIIRTFCEKRDKVGVRATLSDFIDNIDYLVKLVGIDSVGLGLDLVPFWERDEWDAFGKEYGRSLSYPHKRPPSEDRYVEGFDSISDVIKITEELLARGYSEDDTKKIIGGNWLRLLREVWK